MRKPNNNHWFINFYHHKQSYYLQSFYLAGSRHILVSVMSFIWYWSGVLIPTSWSCGKPYNLKEGTLSFLYFHHGFRVTMLDVHFKLQLIVKFPHIHKFEKVLNPSVNCWKRAVLKNSKRAWRDFQLEMIKLSHKVRKPTTMATGLTSAIFWHTMWIISDPQN